ncbi:unnamed protein product [Dibothriocephalus latus]|uniref:Uncharacterized protein n=1 Tax=Dibothriocephalus latus TaxID=60516 RepID=A0A3P7LC13_DIBLA|nr:unnamed protein product [Dibothriocephalus latus]
MVFNWRPLPCLYELNIARNNLASVPQITMAQLFWRTCFSQTGRLACLSLAYTCMSFDQLTWILKILAREIKPRDIVPIETAASALSSDDSDAECVSSKCTLRVLCLQNFVPPAEEVGRVLLHLAVALPRLRFFHLYPAFYAFPGANEKEQQRNRSQEIAQSNAYIRRRGCNNLQIRQLPKPDVQCGPDFLSQGLVTLLLLLTFIHWFTETDDYFDLNACVFLEDDFHFVHQM